MPLYFTEGGEGVFNRVNAVCDRIELENEVQCTVHFRVLVFNALTAIVEDPSESWTASPVERRTQYNRFLKNLPNLILDLAKNDSAGQKLSYFDGLHWLSSRLDSICPFEKSPERRQRRGTQR